MSDQRLKKYMENRDFKKTPEPKATIQSLDESNRFVVQMHQARRLHFDLRLEVNGVLKSWAVPKGPSMNPQHKRLAVQVEDHPLEYATFEGIIPEGEYGAGTVIVWDRGVYRNITVKNRIEQSMEQAIEAGHITFLLLGRKLKGEFALIRLKGGKENNWLLIKKNDEWANPAYDSATNEPQSVLSGSDYKI